MRFALRLGVRVKGAETHLAKQSGRTNACVGVIPVEVQKQLGQTVGDKHSRVIKRDCV